MTPTKRKEPGTIAAAEPGPELTHREAAAFLKVSESALYLWARRGDVPRHKRAHSRGPGGSGRTYYLVSELEAFKREHLPPEK